jgi:cytochrome c oxidase subunit 3
MDTVIVKDNNLKNRINPQKFALWLAMASILMMFAAFTSAYIVKQAAGNWLEFPIPTIFFVNTAVIIISSIALQYSFSSFKTGKEQEYKWGLVITFILGIAFVGLQIVGWNELFAMGIDLKGNPSGSFLYLITGIHAAHVIGGIAALFIALFHAFTLKFKPSEKRKNRFELVIQYWHFIGLLWVYLLGFLILK